MIAIFDVEICNGYLTKSPIADELAERWYGRYHGDKLVLDLVEMAYLLSQGKLVVMIGDKDVASLEELMKMRSECFDRYFWPMLSVYKDLRDRGRRVRVLEPMKFLVKDKAGELRLVYVLEEKYSVEINSLRTIAEEARRNDLEATIAIVSLHGELTYYDLITTDLRGDRDDGV
ncbi:MAG: endonuclease [Desulfurococcaceae archaeon]